MAGWLPLFASSSVPGFNWQQLKIGAGGWISGIDMTSDGTKVIRTDTFGAYKWNTSTLQWDLLNTKSSMPSGHFGHDASGNYISDGVYEIKIAPSNTSRFYMSWMDKLYRTDNGGASWTYLSGFSTTTGCSGNDHTNGNCLCGPKIAVDPINADHVLYGTANAGLWRTTDAGVNWTKITDIPNATNSVVLVLFDPSSTQSGGKTQGLYCGSAGNGIYKSTNAGVNFSTTSYPLTTVGFMDISTAGTLYVCANDGTDTLRIYNGTSWSSKSVGSGGGNFLWAVAVDPSSNAKIATINVAGKVSYSNDTAATFSGYTGSNPTRTITSGDPPWLGTTLENYMSAGGIKFDPSASNKLYFAEGIGVWYCNPSTSIGSGSTVWNSQSKGIEQLVANGIISPPSNEALVYGWDRPGFRIANPLTYPSNQIPNNNVAITVATGMDWASSSPSTIVLNASYLGTNNAFSTDGGQNWTTLSPPAGANIGGNVAASSATNWVWVGASNDLNIYYTTNGSATPTWNLASITGPTSSGFMEGNGSINKQCLCADRVNANTFYIYYNGTPNSNGAGTNADGAIAGIYKSTNSGANWSKVFSGRLANSGSANLDYSQGYYATHLRSVPNLASQSTAGHLFWCTGDVGGSVVGACQRSFDGGATWTVITGLTEILDVGFGAPLPGNDYPTVYVAGWVGGTSEANYGIYRSTSSFASWSANTQTWTKLTDYPYGNPDYVKCISGDSNTYGKVYVGFIGSGWAYTT